MADRKRAVGLRARIHQGAAVVGGNIVEVEHQGYHLVIDLGLPLGSRVGDCRPSTLPYLRPSTTGANCLGVLLSHNHPDHAGLVGQLNHGVAIYAGAASARISTEASWFTSNSVAFEPSACFEHRRPIEIGPFLVTPFLVDHSAYDSYALLIEADGRRLFYSGDFRAHGRKRRLFTSLLKRPPEKVDVLLTEGTRIAEPTATARGLPSEADVERQLTRQMIAARGLVLIAFSPQNIDRLVSVYRSSRASGRTLVLDLYGAAVAAATANPRVPQASWRGVRVLVTGSQRMRIKRSGEFARARPIQRHRIGLRELQSRPQDHALLFRESMTKEIGRNCDLNGAVAVWSMWRGYLGGPSGTRLRRFLTDRAVPLTVHHCSGHATRDDLLRLATALRPDRIVPIHTSEPRAFADLLPNVEIRKDGEWWQV